MDENKIRAIVKDEMKKNEAASRFNFRSIPLHTHNGTDSEKIQENNIIPSASVSGRITFAQATTYTLNLNASFTPSNIIAYGTVVDNSSAPTVRCQTIGSASLTPSFYLQPGGSTFVTTGDIQYPLNGVPVQSSSYIAVITGGSPPARALSSEGHIVSIEYPQDTIHARATVIGFSKESITIDVPNLDSGWEIIVNYVIT